jgi:cytochrome c-type biogenesis protein CcmH/NrfG
VRRRRDVLRRSVRVVTALAVLLAGAAVAQDAPDAALTRAERALEAALASDAPRSPDAAVWTRALDAARAAVDVSGTPPDADALTLLARAYQGAGWWSRAVETWQELEATRGPLRGEDARAWRDAAVQLAYARYQAGDRVAAAARLGAVLERDPNDLEALRWSGRIALELDRPGEAAGWYARLLALAPDDVNARFQLELAREREAHGRAASDAFREGLARLDAGDVDAAVDAFARAEAADPSWLEPLRWRARTLMENERAGAVDAWLRLVERDPDDDGARYFLARARTQAEVGRVALLAADEARAAASAGQPAQAAQAWSRALEAAPAWRDARVGLARAATASGDAVRAEAAWSDLLADLPEEDPLRAEARQGLATARLLGRLGPEAADAYARAEAAFERGAVEDAVAALEQATRAAPDAPEPWAFLGRIAFARADWRSAAQAYEQAARLAPADPDLAFFAREARALAGPDPDGAPADRSPVAPLPPGDPEAEE